MRKRIKAIVKMPKQITAVFAEEVLKNGKKVTGVMLKDCCGVICQIYNVRYKGKLYYIERCENSMHNYTIKGFEV
jgi:hypothetical protein